jgi:hypothetical protein
LLTATSDLRASVSGKDVPEDIKTRLLTLHEDNVVIKEQLKTTQDKLAKARQVRDTAKNVVARSVLLSVYQVSG